MEKQPLKTTEQDRKFEWDKKVLDSLVMLDRFLIKLKENILYIHQYYYNIILSRNLRVLHVQIQVHDWFTNMTRKKKKKI